MATFSVRTETDGGPGSLRDAVERANGNSGPDTILFDDGITFLRLTLGEIEITDALTIDGLGRGVTITGDAAGDDVVVNGVTDVAASLAGEDRLDDNSRIFNVTNETADTRFVGLTLTGGRTTAEGDLGGAVFSLADLTVERSLVAGNSTAGDFSSGGGIVGGGAVTVTNSTVSGNSTAGYQARGGGIAADGLVTVTSSTISGNSTAGEISQGGGLVGSGAATGGQSAAGFSGAAP